MKKFNKNKSNYPSRVGLTRLVLAGVLLAASAGRLSGDGTQEGYGRSATGEAQVEPARKLGDEQQHDRYQQLFSYTLLLMKSLKTTLSDEAERRRVADVVAEQALQSFDDIHSAKSWLTFVGMQSQFDARGPRGKKIKGIGRLAPRYKKYLVALCAPGGDDKTTDLRQVKAGSRISACYFSRLLQATGSLVAVYGLYREGASAKRVMDGTIVRPDVATLYQNVLATNLFPDGMTPRISSIFAHLSMVSAAGVTRRVVDTWIIKDVARLFLKNDRHMESWLGAVASINQLNSYRRPGYLGKKIAGFGGVSRKLDHEDAFGCGGDKVDARARDDAYISMFLSACMFGGVLEAVDGDSNLAAGLFASLQRNKVKMEDVMREGRSPTLFATGTRIKNVKTAVRLINATNIKYSNIQSKLGPKLINIHAASAAGEAIFGGAEAIENWFILLRIENNFNHNGVSPVGATGLGQLMPEYVSDFGKSCGIFDVSERGVRDLAMNAILSSCYFRQLVDEQEVIQFALAGYNAGPNSKTLERVKQFSSINKETANYIVRFSLAKELLSKPPSGEGTKFENHLLTSSHD